MEKSCRLELLELPPLGCVNLHGSLLPKYRGAAPIQRAVLNGETETGVTSMYMAPALDSGDIILVKKRPSVPTRRRGSSFPASACSARSSSPRRWPPSETARRPATKQNDSDATYAPPLTKDLCPIDWNNSARGIVNQVRGLNPWPVATACVGGVTLKIFRASVSDRQGGGTPGAVLSAGADGIEVACGDGAVLLRELQAPGGRRMRASDYLRGHPLCR